MLRPPTARDHERLFAWYNDPEIVAPFDRFQIDAFDAFLAALEAAPEDPASTAPRWVIEERATHELLGFVGHYQAHPVLAETDVWYVMGRVASRGHGFGSEAVGLLVDHLLDVGPAPRVGATTDVENVSSIRLLERVGFRAGRDDPLGPLSSRPVARRASLRHHDGGAVEAAAP